MKLIMIAVLGLFMASCASKVPFTESVKKEYNLNEENLKKVQFYTSSTIILTKSATQGNNEISVDGKIVSNQQDESNRLFIYPNTKCIFEKYGPAGEVFIRFEVGPAKTLKFVLRQQANGKYYLDANWKANGEVEYGNEKYYIDSKSGNAFLLVAIRKMKKTKRKDRVVKGIKV